MPSEHARAVALAEAQSEALRRLLAAMGSADAPGGVIWRAYIVARQALGARWSAAHLAEVLRILERDVMEGADVLLARAAALGGRGAAAQLQTYGIAPRAATSADVVGVASAALRADLAARAQAILAGWQLQPDPTLVVGDDNRVGALTPAPVATALARSLVQTEQAAFMQIVRATPRARPYKRQAIATLGGRTTRCCLAVHGQIVGMDEPFTLTAPPNFGGRLMSPPFHYYCRTVVALVPPGGGDDTLTAQMRAGAAAEEAARAQGTTNQQQRSPTAVSP